jgi:hypothetical protein
MEDLIDNVLHPGGAGAHLRHDEDIFRPGRASSTEPTRQVLGLSFGTCSFPYRHAFGVDDDVISHKPSLARAKSCSRRRSVFLIANGSFFVSAEGGA